MTEPREPETTLDDGEPTRTIETQKAEPATWYPVDARPGDAEPEPADEAPEPIGDAEPVAAGLEAEPPAEPESVETEPVETEPVAVEAEPATVEPEPTPEAAPEAQTVEPEAAAEPSIPVEPEPVQEPVAVEPEPVAAAPAADAAEEATVVVPEDSAPVAGEAEPTIATEVPAEETVALASEPTVATEQPAEDTVALTPEPAVVEPTAVLVQGAPVPTTPPPNAPTDAIFRQPSPVGSPDFEPTRMEHLTDEEQKLAAERAARRDARATALAASAPVPLVAPEPVIVHKRTNDKFWGSVGLFLLRLVVAAILAVRGLNLLTDIPAAQASFAKTIIPYPGIMAIVTGVAALLIALSLVLGLLTRVAGLGIALIGGGALAFVYWGNWSPFIAGRPGFLGDYELLLAAVGVLLLCIGAGGWSLDRSIRAGRARNKAERASAAE